MMFNLTVREYTGGVYECQDCNWEGEHPLAIFEYHDDHSAVIKAACPVCWSKEQIKENQADVICDLLKKCKDRK